jgi:hypothetical protein
MPSAASGWLPEYFFGVGMLIVQGAAFGPWATRGRCRTIRTGVGFAAAQFGPRRPTLAGLTQHFEE